MCSSASAAPANDELAQFLKRRLEYAAALTEPIAVCVGRKDTDHPSFSGCIDWHSSVHGVWALTAYGLVSGDRHLDGLALRRLTKERLAQELRELRGHPSF